MLSLALGIRGRSPAGKKRSFDPSLAMIASGSVSPSTLARNGAPSHVRVSSRLNVPRHSSPFITQYENSLTSGRTLLQARSPARVPRTRNAYLKVLEQGRGIDSIIDTSGRMLVVFV
jgi:hypothetical protein